MSEVVVTGPTSPPIATADDLSGKTVHVRQSSSYFESLEALNARLKQAGKPPVKIVLVPDALEDEDMMEMLNAGVLENDRRRRLEGEDVGADPAEDQGERGCRRARRRQDRLGDPQGQPEAAGGDARRSTKDYLKKQGVAEYRMKQYMSRVKQMKNNATGRRVQAVRGDARALREIRRRSTASTRSCSRRRATRSRTLNQNAKSHVGAIGVMQIMPATGAELKVGDITQIEPNIHAGAKYMDQLMTQYFKDAKFNESNRTLFAFASYNAGPGNISKMRKEAEKRGLDPDKWFNNVEIVTAEKIGIETTTYVRNIYKYYVVLQAHLRI